MDAENDSKPKRKYVMTPEHRAKVLANLGKARLAPKEKVYRKTPKRYAANLNNLGIANAKRRQEGEVLSAKMEGLFPPPEVPPPLLPRLQQSPGDPPRRMPPCFFLDPMEEAKRLIGKRLRKVHATVRREGRRIMRLLTAALKRSQPLSVEEARNLVCQLLKCLDGARVTEEARRLNGKIAHLLGKMIEVQYGVEPGAVPVEIWLEQLREDRRARAAAARERRAARKAARTQEAGEVGKGNSVTPGDMAEARAEVGPASVVEGGKEKTGDWGGQRNEPSNISIPELPETLEEFQDLVGRALDLEDEPEVAGVLSGALWNRLHLWKEREETEAQELERFFQKGAANPPDSYPNSYKELYNRAYDIPLILKLDDDFLRWMDQLTERVEKALDWWVSMIPSIQSRRASRPAEFPAKPPVRVTSDQPATGSEDLPSVA
ncbi:MAG TPA: hypothetical protein VKM93_15355 [Terriglobia bacterium]|nr:hypothetical protein [Terriglobia bacterium]